MKKVSVTDHPVVRRSALRMPRFGCKGRGMEPISIIDRSVNGQTELISMIDRFVNGQTELNSMIDRSVKGRTELNSIIDRSVNGRTELISIIDRSVNGQAELISFIDRRCICLFLQALKESQIENSLLIINQKQ